MSEIRSLANYKNDENENGRDKKCQWQLKSHLRIARQVQMSNLLLVGERWTLNHGSIHSMNSDFFSE